MKSAAHQYEDKLLEFAYGELPQHEADAVDAHVRGCTKCAESLAEIRGVRATMSQLPMEAPPDAGLDSLLAYAEQAARRNATVAAPPSLWKRLLMPLASIAALATVGVVGFRASQEFDTSPAAAVADQKLEQKQQAEQLAQRKLAKDEYAAPAPAQEPAPLAAAAPMPKNDLEGGASGEVQEKPADVREAMGKRGGGDLNELEPRKVEAKSISAPQSQSATRRAQKQKAELPKEEAVAFDDYSNAAQRGAMQKEAPPPPPATKAPATDKAGSLFGLGTGSTTGGLGGARGSFNGPAANTAPSAPAPSAAPAPKPAPAPAKIVTEEESAKKGAKLDSAPPPSKKSYGLRPLAGSSSTAAPEADESEREALQRSDALSQDRDAKFAERSRAENRTQSLESARVAANKGDRTTEIRLLQDVLASGAVGSERAEALKRLCDAYEALGQAGRADPYCDALLSEFPNSTAARLVAERRGMMQTVPAKAAPVRKASEAQPATTSTPSAY